MTGIRSGTASLPLHGGRVPEWLASRMALLGAAVAETVILFEGRGGFLRRLSDPFWFQAFGAVMGMDWHSSGITTSVMGALKRGLTPKSDELGLYIFGGRGRHSRKTPEELLCLANRTGLDGDALVRTSKLTAKVDNTAIQDGFSLYLHSFVVTNDGRWAVVQQGMNGPAGLARRYHWRSEAVTSFVEEPHDAVVGKNQGIIVNLTDRRAKAARETTVLLANQSPDKTAAAVVSAANRHLQMPSHHDVRPTDVFLRRLLAVLSVTANRGVRDFEELLLTEGLGPRTLQALSLVSETAFGAPSRFDDPARFSFAHGGKDGHPFPVPLKVYDQTIDTLRQALHLAKLGETDKIEAFRRLDRRKRELEQRIESGPSLEQILENEWRESPRYGGMTVMGPASKELEQRVRKTPAPKREDRQLKLFR